MNNLIDDVHELMKLSESELTEKLLDDKYNKANLRELVRRSLKLASDYEKAYHYQQQVAEENNEEEICAACNGSGIYDHFGSPPCASCNGTGIQK